MSQFRILTRDCDLETGWVGDGTAAAASGSSLHQMRCGATSEFSVATWLSSSEDVTQPRSPVISSEVGVNVNNCNKLHKVHADAAAYEMTLLKM